MTRHDLIREYLELPVPGLSPDELYVREQSAKAIYELQSKLTQAEGLAVSFERELTRLEDTIFGVMVGLLTGVVGPMDVFETLGEALGDGDSPAEVSGSVSPDYSSDELHPELMADFMAKRRTIH